MVIRKRKRWGKKDSGKKIEIRWEKISVNDRENTRE